jgi:DNA (cytosine-5)-methyltransferase 1
MKIGSLFSGYGGLDMAVSDVFGADVAWHVEFDKAPSAILAHHWPDVPNYGDVTAVDWSTVEPVDIITGGFPCQDLSHAGKRAGLREGTRSGLWSYMAEAVNVLQPDLVVIENVLGILSARAASDVEPCPMCLGDNTDSVMRALGTVCADLAEIGFDARWTTLRAADAGACHGRARVFIIAYPQRERYDGRGIAGTPQGEWSGRGDVAGLAEHDLDLLPTPKASDGPNGGPSMRNGRGEIDALPAIADLLPTPDASAANYRLGGGRSNRAVWKHEPDEASLLPTPTVQDAANNAGPSQWVRNSLPLNTLAVTFTEDTP